MTCQLKGCVRLMVCLCWCVMPAMAQPDAGLAERGALQEKAEHLRPLMPLIFKGHGLVIDRDAWQGDQDKSLEQRRAELIQMYRKRGYSQSSAERVADRELKEPAVKQLFEQVKRKLTYRSSGSIGGSSGRRYYFHGGPIGGELEFTDQQVVLRFTETKGRTLELADAGQGAFRLQLTDDKARVFMMLSSVDGPVTVIDAEGPTPRVLWGVSMAELLVGHREYMQQRVWPMLHDLGVDVPPLPSDPLVVRKVIAALTPLPGDIDSQGQLLIRQLNDDRLQVRERATAILTDHYQTYEPMIDQARKRIEALPLETAERLNRIVKEKTSGNRESKTIKALDLTRQPRYLIELMDQADAATDQLIIAQLRKLTGKDLGPSPDDWRVLLKPRPDR